MSCTIAEHHHSKGESLERVSIGLELLDPGRDLQDACSRNELQCGILLNVEHLSDAVNPSCIGRADAQSECAQASQDLELPKQSEQSAPIFSQISQNFSWENFYYAFFLGLLPTAWDIWTDVQFGLSQEADGEEMTAGFCYMFICLPALSILLPALVSRVQKEWGKVVTGLQDVTDMPDIAMQTILGDWGKKFGKTRKFSKNQTLFGKIWTINVRCVYKLA